MVYYGRVKRHGKLYTKKLGTELQASKKALWKWLGETDRMAAAAADADTEGRLVTWGDFEEQYWRSVKYQVRAEKTRAYRRECINRIVVTWRSIFEEEIRDQKITTIGREKCAVWAANIRGYYSTTYNNTVSIFRKIFEQAVKIGVLLRNPAADIERLGKLNVRQYPGAAGGILGEPDEELTTYENEILEFAGEKDAPWYPSPEEFAAIISKMRSHKYDSCHFAANFAELLAYSGCRLREAKKLRWTDVNWESQRLRVSGAKPRATSDSPNTRYVPLNPALAGLLKRLEQHPHEAPDRIGRVKECRRAMQRACRELSMPRELDHHDLRHWFTTRAIADGVPIPVVADWLGHKDGGVLLLRVYRHRDDVVNQDWAKKLRLEPNAPQVH